MLGAIFNRLVDDDSFYGLAACREAVTQYFALARPGQRAYGFLPELPPIEEGGDDAALLASVAAMSAEFQKRVNVTEIVSDAAAACDGACCAAAAAAAANCRNFIHDACSQPSEGESPRARLLALLWSRRHTLRLTARRSRECCERCAALLWRRWDVTRASIALQARRNRGQRVGCRWLCHLLDEVTCPGGVSTTACGPGGSP